MTIFVLYQIVMVTITTQNFSGNPFIDSYENSRLIIAKNEAGVIWINWLEVPNFEYLKQQTLDEAKPMSRNDHNFLCQRAGDIPKIILDLLNYKF